MPRQEKGARLYFDEARQNWVIRDGRRFIRTGAAGWGQAQERLRDYLKDCPLDRRQRALAVSQPELGLVYFMSADFPDFPVKIGFTTKPQEMRSKGVQTGCPYRIVVLGTFSGTFGDERALHRRFKAHRLEGEWFSRTPELMNTIQERTAK